MYITLLDTCPFSNSFVKMLLRKDRAFFSSENSTEVGVAQESPHGRNIRSDN